MDLSYGLMILTGDPTTYHEASAAFPAPSGPYAPGAVGKFFMIPDDAFYTAKGPKVYQLVKITSVTSAAQGAPLYWTSNPNTKEVTTAVTNAGLGAGILVNSAANLPAANEFIFMQVRGLTQMFVKATPAANPTATGLVYAVQSGIGTVDGVTVSPATGLTIFGKFVEASTGNELVDAVLTVPIFP